MPLLFLCLNNLISALIGIDCASAQLPQILFRRPRRTVAQHAVMHLNDNTRLSGHTHLLQYIMIPEFRKFS